VQWFFEIPDGPSNIAYLTPPATVPTPPTVVAKNVKQKDKQESKDE